MFELTTCNNNEEIIPVEKKLLKAQNYLYGKLNVHGKPNVFSVSGC